MKIKIIKSIFVIVALLVPQVIKAQGTTYIYNLDQPSTGIQAVGSDSWLALDFITGNNPGGYLLDSVQLGMSGASGSPNGFSVMIYQDAHHAGGLQPGGILGTLSGPTDPVNNGVYTFNASGNLMLLPNTDYFIVLTAGTPLNAGFFGLNFVSTYSYPASDGWGLANAYLHSSTGSSWVGNFETPQYAINATAVPEPSVFMVFALAGLPWAWRRFCRGC